MLCSGACVLSGIVAADAEFSDVLGGGWSVWRRRCVLVEGCVKLAGKHTETVKASGSMAL